MRFGEFIVIHYLLAKIQMCGLSIVVTFSLLFFITGCATSHSQPSVSLPQWVSNPSHDDAFWLYGLGHGTTVDRARQAALADIVARLYVKVSGSTTIRITSRGNKILQSMQDSIKTQLNETRLSHYRVDRVASVNDGFWVQLKVASNMLAQVTETSLTNSQRYLRQAFKRFVRLSSIKKYIQADALSAEIDKAERSRVLLQTLQPLRRDPDVDKTLLHYRELIRQARESLSFSIKHSDDTQSVADKLAAVLSEHSVAADIYAAKDFYKNKKHNQPVIHIAGKFRHFDIFSQKQVQADITITVHDEFGALIAKRQYVLAGSSVTSFAQAKRAAVRELSDKLTAQGIFKSLGITKHI